ncbi:MAG TPA: ribosome silencing factor [Methylophilaceae bacterium]|jgi:ribosome-associated protein
MKAELNTMKALDVETMKSAVVDALEDVKAIDIKVMDVTKLTAITSYMIVASGSSNRQTKSLAHNVVVKIKELGGEVYGIEGEKEGEWVLVDLGDILVHVMQPSVRDYYNLEQLWGAAESRRAKAENKTA